MFLGQKFDIHCTDKTIFAVRLNEILEICELLRNRHIYLYRKKNVDYWFRRSHRERAHLDSGSADCVSAVRRRWKAHAVQEERKRKRLWTEKITGRRRKREEKRGDGNTIILAIQIIYEARVAIRFLPFDTLRYTSRVPSFPLDYSRFFIFWWLHFFGPILNRSIHSKRVSHQYFHTLASRLHEGNCYG